MTRNECDIQRGIYLMFEDREVCGLTSDVEEVAKFIAEGWEY